VEQVRAVLFDLDGTLLDGSGSQGALMRTCTHIANLRDGLDAPRLFEANGDAWRAYWPGVEDKWALGVLDSISVSSEGWRRALRACGCEDEAVVRLATETYRRHQREALRLFEDVQTLFAFIRNRLQLGLITNGASDTQRGALRAMGIEDEFRAIVISGEVGIAKPSAAVFGLALDKLGLEPKNVWHVGDSLGTDVAGAKAAGIAAVWLNRNGALLNDGDPKPDYEIRSLAELAEILPAS
jgi:putative hydrolase of the HAD superfamily